MNEEHHYVLDKTKTIVGCCKECLANVYKEDAMIPEWPNLYECSNCFYPNNEGDLFE